jgi:hypothetical protein
MIERTCCPTPPNTSHTGACPNSLMRSGKEKFFTNELPAHLKPVTVKDRNFLIMIFYEGPWERLSSLFVGLRKDCTLRWIIPENPVGWRKALGKLAAWTEQRDSLWRAKYAVKRRNPHKRWKR